MELNEERLLVIAPHADDEVLGCTGLIDHVIKRDGKVQILYATNGKTADITESGIKHSSSEQRRQEIAAVTRFLGYSSSRIAFPEHHLRLDTVPRLQLIGEIERDVCNFRPTIIAVTPEDDYNQDHEACAKALAAAARPAPGIFKPLAPIILQYISVSNFDWDKPFSQNPNFFIAMERADVERKIEAMRLYSSQIRTDGHERSPENLEIKARYWGLRIGAYAAEPFFASRISTV